jgi:hypothetical protein
MLYEGAEMNEGRERARRGATQRLNDDQPVAGATPSGTEPLDPSVEEWRSREPVNPDWRSTRSSQRTARRKSALPSSPQEFQLWLQKGGWRYGLGIALLLVGVLIALLAFGRSGEREAGLGLGESGAGADTPALDLTPIIAQPEAPVTEAEPAAPPPAAFGRFAVVGTGGQGLLLRPGPSRDGAALATLPDGTQVEQIGEDVAGGDFVWRQVRAPDGQEGWVAVDFLVAAP